MRVDKQMLADLIDERLPRAQVRAIQSGYKDTERFDTYLELLQERAPFDVTFAPRGGGQTPLIFCKQGLLKAVEALRIPIQ